MYIVCLIIAIVVAAAFGKGCYVVGHTLGQVDATLKLDKENFAVKAGHREPDIYLPPRMQPQRTHSDIHPSHDTWIDGSADLVKDVTKAERALLRQSRRYEGICPNGCAVMALDNSHNRHCPKCGFKESSDVSFSVITVSDAWEELKDCKL